LLPPPINNPKPAKEPLSYRTTTDSFNPSEYEVPIEIAKEFKEDPALVRLHETYKKRYSKLPCCVRLWVYLRHGLVFEVMFRKSLGHMRQMVSEVYKGDTFIKNTIDEQLLKESSAII